MSYTATYYQEIASGNSPVAAAVSNHYKADTSGGAITFNLPGSRVKTGR